MSSSRRSNGEGSVSRHASGGWRGRMWVEDARTGERRRVEVYGRTKSETTGKLREAAERAGQGVAVRADRRTVEVFLGQWGDVTLEASSRRPSTKEVYRLLLRAYVVPHVGQLRLDQLRPMHVEGLILEMRNAGLSASTVRQTYTVLRMALDVAVRDGLLPRNPAAAVPRPAVPRRDAVFLTPEQVKAVLRDSAGARLHPMLLLLVVVGMRRGEALGLRWADVDLEAGTARITGTLGRVGKQLVRHNDPKTSGGRRTVPLPPAVVDVLRAHRKRQTEDRLRVGSAWQGSELVFTTEVGGPVDPRNALRWYYGVAAKAGVPGSLHTLRHSAATMMLSRGESLRLVADVLGHSSTRITGDVYAHVLEQAPRAAVEGVADVLGLGTLASVPTPISTPIGSENTPGRPETA